MRSRLRQSIVFALGLSLGVSATATAAVAGDAFRLGVTNTIVASTKLTGSYTSTLLQVLNTSTGSTARAIIAKTASTSAGAIYAQNTGGGPAAQFLVNSGKAPFTVNSLTKVRNLNADQVDGYSGSQMLGPTAFGHLEGSLSGVTIVSATANVASASRIGVGQYCIAFTAPIDANRLRAATATTVYGPNYPDAKIGTNCPAGQLGVTLINDTPQFQDGHFNFIVP